jgi:uncharacterized protein YdcH (DUF465 family)
VNSPHSKTADTHFARRHEEYHAVNRMIHRVEPDVEPMEGLAFSIVRKYRIQLKDELYKMAPQEHS